MPKNKELNDNSTSDQTLRPRPIWQRLIYPFAGIILIILGIVLWITPVVMGFPLIIIGVPLVLCFHPRLELWGRKKIKAIHQSLKSKFKHKN
jgi:hypothetical protein